MNIPARQFELRQQPPTGVYILSFFGSFLLSAAICVPLGSMTGKLSLIFFPLGPVLLTAVAVYWMHAPCTVTVDNSGLSIEVKRSSIGISSGTRFWPWAELLKFDYLTNRSAFLILTLNGATCIFSRGELLELRNFLRDHFPEKERIRNGWGF